MMVEVNASERELVMREFEQIKFDVQDWAHLEKCAHFELIPGKGRSDQHPCLQCFAAYQRGKDAHVATICVLTSVLPCSRDRFLDGSIPA